MAEDITTEEKINIRYSETDFDRSLKPSALLNFLQDVASDNAERLGFGFSEIYPKDLMWVLLKYRIEFSKYPIDLMQLTIRTKPRGYQRLFAYRSFELFNNQQIIGRAFSMWSLVNFKTMGLSSVEQTFAGNPYMKKFEKQEDDLVFGKIPALERIDFSKEFEVRYNDIDVNRHANNGNYIIWALEPLSYDFKAMHKLKCIDMVFKKEIKYGEKLVSLVQMIDDKTSVHYLKHAGTEEDLCQLCCVWG